MHPATPRRSRVRRLAGWSIIGVLYLATLTFAATLTAPQQTGAVQPPAQVMTAAAQPATSADLVPAGASEAPLATLSIAGTLVAAATGWYLIHVVRRRHRMRTAAVRANRKLPRGLTIPG